MPYALDFSPSRDSIQIWLLDSALATRDSLFLNFLYTGYDSIEQPIFYSDTLAFSYKKPPPAKNDVPDNPFKIITNFNRTKELGQAAKVSFTQPWELMDTSKIEFKRTRDTLSFPIELNLKQDSLVIFDCRLQIADSSGPSTLDLRPLDSLDLLNPLDYRLANILLPDSSYSLTFFPGAFTTHAGLTNDTTKINFKVKTADKYGIIQVHIEELHEPAVVQLIKGKDVVIAERELPESGEVKFTMLKPGKYKLKIIFDKNNNGRWDPGRYLHKLQADRVLYFGLEFDLKANFELEETWNLKEE